MEATSELLPPPLIVLGSDEVAASESALLSEYLAKKKREVGTKEATTTTVPRCARLRHVFHSQLHRRERVTSQTIRSPLGQQSADIRDVGLDMLAVAERKHVSEQRQQVVSAHARIQDTYHLLNLSKSQLVDESANPQRRPVPVKTLEAATHASPQESIPTCPAQNAASQASAGDQRRLTEPEFAQMNAEK